MKSLRAGLAVIASAGLLATMSACANPTQAGQNASAADVGPAIEVSKDEEVAQLVPADIRQQGSFTVAINPDIAPVKFLDSDGEPAGLIVELLTEAGTVMDLDPTWQQAGFDALVPGLEAQRFDVVASIGDFEERQEKIDFIDYLMTGSAFLVPADHEQDDIGLADLCGMKVAFVRGTYQQGQIDTTTEDCVADGRDPIDGVGYGDANAALLSVKSGQSEGFWGDVQSHLYNAKTSPDLYKVASSEVAGPYGIGINKDDEDFREALRAALLHLVDSGVYDQLLEKWGQQDLGMPEMPLNTGASLEG